MRRATSDRVTASLVVTIALAAAVMATNARAMADETIAVRGRIVDGSTGRAFAGATIIVRDGAARAIRLSTDREGRFVAIGLRAGEIDVTASRDGYEMRSQRCRVSEGDTLRLDFDLVDHYRMLERRDIPCRIGPQTADRYVID